MKSYHSLIDGQEYVSPAQEFFPDFNPRLAEQTHLIAQSTTEDVNVAVAAAARASIEWGKLRPLLRGRALHKISQLIMDHKENLARMESINTGKPPATAIREIAIAAEYFEFFGNLTSQSAGDLIDIGEGSHCFNRREPYGVVGVITPWNLPLNQLARSVAAALAAGNTVVVKPSEHTSASTLELVKLIFEANILPSGVLNVITGAGATGSALASHKDIAKVSFTGSVATGKKVGAICAEAVKPVTLELGGKSPNIVLADVDLEQAVAGCVKGFTSNAGQVCIAGTRIYVHASIYEQFKELLVKQLKTLDQSADNWAPIITGQQYQKVLDFISEGEKEGLNVLYKSDNADVPQKGWYVPRVVFEVANERNCISANEIFGHVAALTPYEDIEDCLELANDTEFGLAAGIWGNNLNQIYHLVANLDAGQIFVNGYFAGGVENPLGGFKESGLGKEKGIEAYMNYQRSKNVVISLAL